MADDNFTSAEHALLGGMVWGYLASYGIPITPVMDDDDDYTNRYKIEGEDFPGGSFIVALEPPEL